jgi:hypothetical protein
VEENGTKADVIKITATGGVLSVAKAVKIHNLL